MSELEFEPIVEEDDYIGKGFSPSEMLSLLQAGAAKGSKAARSIGIDVSPSSSGAYKKAETSVSFSRLPLSFSLARKYLGLTRSEYEMLSRTEIDFEFALHAEALKAITDSIDNAETVLHPPLFYDPASVGFNIVSPATVVKSGSTKVKSGQ